MRQANTANPPLDKLRDAIDYALKHRDTLKSWLDNPCLPIDNNTVERAVRPVTVGRKNYLFIGAPEAGQRAAVLYTMLGECKRSGVDPLAWLTHVLQILPAYRGDHADLLPGSLTLPQTPLPGSAACRPPYNTRLQGCWFNAYVQGGIDDARRHHCGRHDNQRPVVHKERNGQTLA